MKRVLPDTNIYGEMVIDPDIEVLKENIRGKVVIYGFRLISLSTG